MNIQFKKIQTMIVFALLLVLAGALSACNLTSTDPGVAIGVAGGDATDTPTEAPVVVTEPPTATPIPDTYGHIIFVSQRDGKMHLYMTTPDGADPIQLTSGESDDSDPQVSPDGTRVAFTSTVGNNTDIYVLDLTTRNLTRVTDSPEKDSAPSWSRDGTKIAFESFRDGNLEIYLTNADGSNTTRLTNDPAGDSNPVWSPTSDEIAFISNRFGNSDILLLTPTGQVSTLTTDPAPDSAPAWSPDGSRIAFKTSTGELSKICVIQRDGLNQQCLTAAAGDYGDPVWSLDGKWLAATAKQSAGYGITLFDTASTPGTPIELSAADVKPYGRPFWSPEGARLVFSALAGGEKELYTVVIPTDAFTPLASVPPYNGEPIWVKQ